MPRRRIAEGCTTMSKNSSTSKVGRIAGRSTRARSEKDIASPAAGLAAKQSVAAKAKGTPAAERAAKSGPRPAATTAKLSASSILGPVPGRRTVSDERIREAVRDAIRERVARSGA